MKCLLTAAVFLLLVARGSAHATEILNVSYDVTREFYADFNAAFEKSWNEQHGEKVTVNQSHGGSSKQARSVLDGLAADVVTMNQETDIGVLAKAGLVSADWKSAFPNNSAPYTSTIVFLVRKGNPKKILNWGDLARDGVSVIIPNPKTSGNGRYGYLAAWSWAQQHFANDETKIRDFIARMLRNVPVLETGGRAATNTFVQKEIGDVLLTFESETLQIARVFDRDKYDIVYPPSSISAEAPVALVQTVAEKHGTVAVATDYLRFHWSDQGQKLAAKHYLRPQSPEILKANSALFPSIELISVDTAFNGWDNAQRIHFNDGGTFDQVYANPVP